MSTVFKKVSLANECTIPPIDLKKCVLCQIENKNEEMCNPTKNTRSDTQDGIHKLATNLENFEKLKEFPLDVNVQRLRGADGSIESNLRSNGAVWHKKCYLEFANFKLDRARKRAANKENMTPKISVKKSRNNTENEQHLPSVCLFCNGPENKKNALFTITPHGETMIVKCATEVEDKKILSMGLGGLCQMRYHSACRTEYINEAKQASNTAMNEIKTIRAHDLVIASMVTHIEQEKKYNSDVSPVFKMSELTRIYTSEMSRHGIEISGHSTRLCEQILKECTYLESSGGNGQEILLTIKKNSDKNLREGCVTSHEGFHLANAAKLLRRDIYQKVLEEGQDKVPKSLSTFITMLLKGSGLTEGDEGEEIDQVVQSLSQLIVFQTRKRVQGNIIRHKRAHETDLPKYVAAKLYTATRKKCLIDVFYRLGLCVSYERLQLDLTEKALKSCQVFEEEGVVCPVTLRKSVFTTAAADNIDHDTSSTTATTAFHGTAISLVQHRTQETTGEERDHSSIEKAKKLQLPNHYAHIQPLCVDLKAAKITPCDFNQPEVRDALHSNQDWLDNSLNDDLVVPYGAYLAQKNRTEGKLSANIGVLPVFREEAHTASTMAHCMEVSKKAINFLNPGQTPVLVVDQPLYAICKQLQWLFPYSYGEKKFVVFFGGLHIEQVALKITGEWLNGSGWTSALVEAQITTTGRADGALKATHLTRSRYCHQVSAVVLYRLMHKAFELYSEDNPITFSEWRAEMRTQSVMFHYWEISLVLEMMISELVRCTRISNFHQYVSALDSLAPWCFALNHTNYARWLPIEISRLQNLHLTNPDVYAEFMKGHFTVSKTTRSASAMSLDQAHEQVNAHLKGNGGIIGLQEDAYSLLKFMVVSPELAADIEEFEKTFTVPDAAEEGHHLETMAARKRFCRDVSSLLETIDSYGNPFLEKGEHLMNIESKKVFSSEVSKTVRNIEAIGKEQYHNFVQQRIKSAAVPLLHKISRNNLALCSTVPKRTVPLTKAKAEIQQLKKDNKLLGQLFVGASSTNRHSDLEVFCAHENREYPPALSQNGELRSTSKSVLMHKLLELLDPTPTTMPPVDAKIFEGAPLIHMLKPGTAKNFGDYTENVFLPFIKRECKDVVRLDLVWDRYFPDSLKTNTREKRGAGQRTKVAENTKIPKAWDTFLRDSDNKTELFRLLGNSISDVKTDSGTVIYSSLDDKVVVNSERQDVTSLSPCNHEESDTRVFVHVADAFRQGHTKILVRTLDTDVLLLALPCMVNLPGLEQLWVHMKVGMSFKFIPIHELAASLGPQRCLAMPAFHAFTGCDNVSSFFGIGKNTAYKALEKFPQAERAFIDLAAGKIEESKPIIFDFVQVMYGVTNLLPSILECRKHFFNKEHKLMENVPPTEDALTQHLLRASYMGQVYQQTMQAQQILPSPADYGWKRHEDGVTWSIRWRTLPVAAKTCNTTIYCKCSGECRGGCGCSKKGVACGKGCKCHCINK